MKTLFFSLLIFQFMLSLACGQQAEAEPYRHPATALVFPEKIAGMVKGKVTNFEHERPGLGISIGYNTPSITTTIYIYTLGLTNIPNGAGSKAILQHFKQVIADVYAAERFGLYKSVMKLSKETVSLGCDAGSSKALSALLAYTQSGTERFSRIYLTGYKDHFIKIRFTYDKAAEANARKTLALFLDEAGKLLLK